MMLAMVASLLIGGPLGSRPINAAGSQFDLSSSGAEGPFNPPVGTTTLTPGFHNFTMRIG